MKQFKITVIIFIISITNLFGQNLKTFSGDYDNGQVVKGKAIFTYYEDTKTLEYVKQGLFKYTLDLKGDYGSYSENISGNYKNGKKDGQWNYILSKIDYPSTNGSFYTGTVKLIANYSNGKPNGTWIYSSQLKHRDKTYSGWTAYENNKSENVTATFNNGKLSGQITFVNNPVFSEYNNITGQFDQKGFLTGKWIFKSPEKEKVLEIKDGILRNFIIREITTGQIVNKEIDDPEMTQIKDDFASGKLSIIDLQNKKIKVDTLIAVKSDLYDFETSINFSQFLHRYIGGDDTYYYKEFDQSSNNYNQKTGWFDTRNYGLVITLTKSKQIELKNISSFESAEGSFNFGNYQSAKEKYAEILRAYSENLSEQDKSLLNDRIAKCDEGAIKNKQFEVVKAKYDKAIQYFNSIRDWNDLFSYKEKAQNASDLFSEIMTNDKNLLDEKDIVAIGEKQKQCNDYLQKVEQNRIESEKFTELQTKNKENTVEIKKAFGVSENVYNGTTVEKKEKLYNAYVEIFNDLNSKLNNAHGRIAQQPILEQIVSLQTQILSLVNGDSKEIEKQLKKATTIAEKMQILKM